MFKKLVKTIFINENIFSSIAYSHSDKDSYNFINSKGGILQ